MVNGTFKYDTQELLSLSMDRLRDYMKKWDAAATGSGDDVLVQPQSSPSPRRSTRIIRKPTHPEVLLVKPDPIVLSQLINTNDAELPDDRLTLSWASGYSAAVAKLGSGEFASVAVFESAEALPDGGSLTGVDFLLLLAGLQPRNDSGFLLRKRAFIEHLLPGSSGAEKVAVFRRVKDKYRSRPFLYVHQPGEEDLAAVAARIHGVRTLAIHPQGTERILDVLREGVI